MDSKYQPMEDIDSDDELWHPFMQDPNYRPPISIQPCCVGCGNNIIGEVHVRDRGDRLDILCGRCSSAGLERSYH